MNHEKHKERLHLAELGKLLKYRPLITVCDILGKFVPDKEYARF